MVRRITIGQQSWISGVSAAIVLTTPIHGRVEQITVTINDNTGNRTLTLAIADGDGDEVYSKAAIPENATTVYTANSNKATQDADFNAFLLDDICTLTFTPSGDPSTTGMTADVKIYVTHGQP